jgi:hypothetical protein
MTLKRICIHEAGHFYVALRYRPTRAVSICISQKSQRDAAAGEDYVSGGQTVTFDPKESLPKVQVSIRAAGLAAESLVYNESFENLMQDPDVLFSIKTDTDNAKRDLEKAGLTISSERDFLFYWNIGFYEAVSMMRGSQDELHRIADYCMGNLDRVISKAEIIAACNVLGRVG